MQIITCNKKKFLLILFLLLSGSIVWYYDINRSVISNFLSNAVITKDKIEHVGKDFAHNSLTSFNAINASVLFCHVPKAGGSSVQMMLEGWAKKYGIETRNQHTITKRGGPKLNSNDLRTTSKPKVFIGHNAWIQYKNNIEFESCDGSWIGGNTLRQPLKVVVLREPIDRLVSLYDFVRHKLRHPKFELYERLYGNQSLDFHLNNMMDDVEANGKPTKKTSSHLWTPMWEQMHFLSQLRCYEGKTFDENYEIALSNLQKFHVIAIMEKMDSTLLPQLKYWLPWANKKTEKVGVQNSIDSLIDKTKQKSAAFSKSVLSPATRERLMKKHMTKQFELYEKAKTLAKERLDLIDNV